MKSNTSVSVRTDIVDPGNQRGLDWRYTCSIVRDAQIAPAEDRRVDPRTESWDALVCYGGISESFLDGLTPEQRYKLLINLTPGPQYRMDTPAWADSSEFYAPEYDGTGSCSHCLEISAAADKFTVSIQRLDTLNLDGTVTPGELYLWAEAPNDGITPKEAIRFSQALKTGASRFQQLKEAGE